MEENEGEGNRIIKWRKGKKDTRWGKEEERIK